MELKDVKVGDKVVQEGKVATVVDIKPDDPCCPVVVTFDEQPDTKVGLMLKNISPYGE